jgi:DNA (cytosine-5)-methyltransferase 1
VETNFLPAPKPNLYPDLHELLSDLIDKDVQEILLNQSYPKNFATSRYLSKPQSDFQKWLRTRPDGKLMRAGSTLLEQEYSKHSPQVVSKFQHMIQNNGEIPELFKTKKFAQRLLPSHWGASGPSITATSLPDDYVHYLQPRTLTVREWARLQTFPDWYEFAGKRTTGGLRRAGNPKQGIFDREVPKYTQIGNAVPVKLAEFIGKHFESILDEAEK